MGEHKHPNVMSLDRDQLREREFERLYLQSYPLVYNYVCFRMADQAAAEDVVAEAFMKAARAFDRFDPARARFSTWVITIAVNCMNSYYRKQLPMSVLDDVPESAFSVEGEQHTVDDRDLVMRLVSALDDDERQLVFMKYQEGKRNVDIAHELGMNASTVATKLSKSLAKMRAVAQEDF